MRVSLSSLESFAANRPAAYKQQMLQAGNVIGSELEIPPEICARIHTDYPRLPVTEAAQLETPSLPDLASNFLAAIASWVAAGFPLRTEAEASRILTVCKGSADGLQPACPEWLGDAIVPRCRKCGCTALKPWLATEKCPLQKWQNRSAKRPQLNNHRPARRFQPPLPPIFRIFRPPNRPQSVPNP